MLHLGCPLERHMRRRLWWVWLPRAPPPPMPLRFPPEANASLSGSDHKLLVERIGPDGTVQDFGDSGPRQQRDMRRCTGSCSRCGDPTSSLSAPGDSRHQPTNGKPSSTTKAGSGCYAQMLDRTGTLQVQIEWDAGGPPVLLDAWLGRRDSPAMFELVPVLKSALSEALNLSKDALHIHVAMLLMLGTALVARRPLSSWLPWAVVLSAAVIGEAFDYLVPPDLPDWRSAALVDLVNTMLWPTAIALLARSRRLRLR